jgi:hypothetical protein
MSNIFLGKPLHWLVLIIIAAGFWYAGELRMHNIHFNAFVMSVLAISAGCVMVVLYGPGRGERLTRDEIVPDEIELRLDDTGPAS